MSNRVLIVFPNRNFYECAKLEQFSSVCKVLTNRIANESKDPEKYKYNLQKRQISWQDVPIQYIISSPQKIVLTDNDLEFQTICESMRVNNTIWNLFCTDENVRKLFI